MATQAATRRRAGRRLNTSDLRGKRTGPYFRVSRADQQDKKTPEAERSTSTQRRIFTGWAGTAGVQVLGEYADPDISASRFAIEKNRPEFERMVTDVRAGKLDVLWFWELSRQQRRLAVFAALRDLCREMGVLWVIRDRVYDPADSGDMLQLGIQSMIAEGESEQLSGRVYDGKESSAGAGKRAGRFPYGYKRGVLLDPEALTFGPDLFDDDGRPDSPARVVREIFERVTGGESLTAVRKSLNDRGARTRNGSLWANSTVRYIAMNPAYAGLRVRHMAKGAGLSRRADDILTGADGQPVAAAWPPLVLPETFWAAYRLLADPDRTLTKPHRPGGRLLAGVAYCGECGCKLTTKLGAPRQRHRGDTYVCRELGCVGIYQTDLDAYVEAVMVAWLADPATVAALQRDGDTAAITLARADAEKARAELAEWRQAAERGEMTAAGYGAFERGALARIADAEQRERDASVPLILRDRIGPAAAAGWAALDIPVRRQMIAAVAEIRVRKVGRHGNRLVPAAERVEWRWLIGAGAGDHGTVRALGDVEKRAREAEASRLAERRERVARMRENGMTRPQIAAELGLSVSGVAKDIAAIRAAA